MDFWSWGVTARNCDYEIVECDCKNGCIRSEKECHTATAYDGKEITGVFKVPFKYGWLKECQ